MIRELSITQFQDFSLNYPQGNIYQTLEYALLKAEEGFDYDLIGYEENNELLAASLIIHKKIGNYRYGYAPRGFLIDYSNIYLLANFTNALIKYYQKKNFAFIKINPEIAISKFNFQTNNFDYNSNYNIINNLITCGYIKLKNNMNFESLLPRTNAIVSLNDFKFTNLVKNTKNKIRKSIRKGLTLEKGSIDNLDIFINLKNDNKSIYYTYLYNILSQNNKIDYLLVKINFKDYLINTQNYYDYELERNNYLNRKIIHNNKPAVINAKMNSDRALFSYKNDIADASKYLNTNQTIYLAGALIGKYKNRLTILESAFDSNYGSYEANYFLYYAILKYYQNEYNYVDLNGVVADFSKDNKYHGLNRFKFGFKPNVYEYVGEFDLPISPKAYNHILKNGTLAKEFNKKD